MVKLKRFFRSTFNLIWILVAGFLLIIFIANYFFRSTTPEGISEGIVFTSLSVGQRKQTFDVGVMLLKANLAPVDFVGGEWVFVSSSYKSRWSDCSLIVISCSTTVLSNRR